MPTSIDLSQTRRGRTLRARGRGWARLLLAVALAALAAACSGTSQSQSADARADSSTGDAITKDEPNSDTTGDPTSCSGDSLRTGLVAQQTGVSVDAFDCQILAWASSYNEPDPMLIKAIIYGESRFDQLAVACPNKPCGTPSGWSDAESGCYGLMQVVPACGSLPDSAGLLPNGHPNLENDPLADGWTTSIFNPEVNIQIGIAGIAALLLTPGLAQPMEESMEERTASGITHQGSCLCGGARFEVSGRFERFVLCHCRRCRKDTGSAHASNLFATQATLRWLSGEALVRHYQLPGTRHARSFCSTCGSALPSLQLDGTLLVVPAGCLDTLFQCDREPTSSALIARSGKRRPPTRRASNACPIALESRALRRPCRATQHAAIRSSIYSA